MRPSRSSESGLEAHREVWEWSGGPPRVYKVVGRPTGRFESGREALP